MQYLGFLKFLKRDKGKEMDFGLEDDLDIPPPPPDFAKDDFGKGGKEFPEFPELPRYEESMDTSDFSIKPSKYAPKEKPLPPLDFPDEEFLGEDFAEEMQEKPFPKLKLPREEEFPKVDMPKPGFQPRPLFPSRQPLQPIEKPESPPIARIRSPYQGIEKQASREEVGLLRNKKSKGPIYVRIERFRNILANANTIRNNLRIASQSIERLNEIDENRDKVFGKWHDIMMDMQKKFIFMDKSVFKKSR